MNRRVCTLLALLLLDCRGTAPGNFPPIVIPPKPSAEEWPDSGAAVLEDEARLEFKPVAGKVEGAPAKLVAVLTHRRRMKVLRETGLAQATVELTIDAFSTVTKVDAQSVSADGEVKVFDPGDIDVMPYKGLAHVPDLKTLRFVIPGASVGGLLDYSYERVFVDVDFVPAWVFSTPMPTVRSELSVVLDDKIKIDFRGGNGTKAYEREPLRRREPDGRERLVFVEQNLPPIYEEPAMPHATRIGPWLAVRVLEADKYGVSRKLVTWNDVRLKLEEMFEAVGASSEQGTPEARFSKVRDALNAVPFDGLGGASPQSASQLVGGLPAVTRDAAAILSEALKGSELPAFPALLAAPVGPPPLEGFPGLFPFVRAVVAVDVTQRVAGDPSCREDPESRGLLCTVPADSYAFLDPLCKYCRFGELPIELTGGRALVFLKDATKWVDVPLDPPERNRTVTQFRYVLEVDGSLRGSLSGELVGVRSRRLREALDAAENTAEAHAKTMREHLFGPETGIEVTKAAITNRKHADKPLGFRGTLASKVSREQPTDETSEIERYRLRVIDVVGPALPERFRTLRRYDVLLDGPAWLETVAAIELPIGYELGELPEVRIVKPFAEYASGFARRERTLAFSRRLIIKAHQLDPQTYEDFRDMLDEIEAAESVGLPIGLKP